MSINGRLDFLLGRIDTVSKNPVLALWASVVVKAIDDIIMANIIRKYGFELKEDEKFLEYTATHFLFDDEYTVPLSDYHVNILCSACKKTTKKLMSEICDEHFSCKCGTKHDMKFTSYDVVQDAKLKTTSFSEVMSIIGIENTTRFRKQIKKYIAEQIETKPRPARCK